MKKIRIKWNNVIKLVIMLVCIGVILHDIYLVGFSQMFTGRLVGFTWYGLFTFFIASGTAVLIYLSVFDEDIF